MKIKSLLFSILLPLAVIGNETALELRCIPSPNLVRNADFSMLNAKGLPQGWYFDNCSKSPEFKTQIIKHADGNYMAIDSAWIKFGYWLQDIQVKEGVPYYVSVDAQSDAPSLAIWLKANPKRKTTKRSPGKTEYLIHVHLRNGDEMKEMLKDFIEEELITVLSSTKWNKINSEVIMPLDRGITKCTMRIGIYGGSAGQGRYRNPVFREAKSTLEAKITGKGWKELKVEGAIPASVKLDPDKDYQTVSVVMPQAKLIYKAEIFNQNGQKISKEIRNE